MSGREIAGGASRIGLCASCRFRRDVRSARGSWFLLCRRSSLEPGFPRYPSLPVLRCAGYEPRGVDDDGPAAPTVSPR